MNVIELLKRCLTINFSMEKTKQQQQKSNFLIFHKQIHDILLLFLCVYVFMQFFTISSQ